MVEHGDVENPAGLDEPVRNREVSRLGFGSPLGWLCTRIIDAAA